MNSNANRKKGCGCWFIIFIVFSSIVMISFRTCNSCLKKDEADEILPNPEATTENEPQETAIPDSVFYPNKPENSNLLSDVILEAKSKYTNIDRFMSALTEEIDTAVFADAFREANDLYKSRMFSDAKTKYEKILSDCPVHLGARNNYALTLVQLEEYKSSLTEFILLGLIHPEYKGNWVNILIPLYALGYDGKSTSGILEDAGLPKSPAYNPGSAGDSFNEIDDAFLYNYVYAYMEAEIGEDEIYARMEEFGNILRAMKDKSPEDTDYSELLAYLEGLQKIRLK